jgi:hypothetical protein
MPPHTAPLSNSRAKAAKTCAETVELDAASLQCLAEDFAPLDELTPRLAWRVMRYLLDGRQANLLADLAALKQAGQKLRLYGSAPPAAASAPAPAPSTSAPSAEGASPRRRFFASVQCSSPVFFERLGRVYEAASRPLRLRMARALGDPDLDWLQILLIEATQLTLHTWPRQCRPCACLTSDLIEAMLEQAGHPRDLLVRAAFLPPKTAQTRFGAELQPVWETLPGLGASAARQPAAVLAALSQSNLSRQLQTLDLMRKCQVPPAAFLAKLFELALSRRKRVRERAVALLAPAPSGAGPFLREKAARGASEERACAVRLLWRTEGENARAFLAARLLEEQTREKKSSKVLRALEELLPPRPTEPGQDEALSPELPSWWKQALGPVAGRAARLADAAAIAPLLAALKQEKNEAARCAMMTSLARAGLPPELFLDRAGLREESARVLARKIPEALNWFPFHRLPAVHWADNGRLVEPEIIRGWLTQCCRREDPEPGPLLRHYAAYLEPGERETLGQFVLEAWISEDARTGGEIFPRQVSRLDPLNPLSGPTDALSPACRGEGRGEEAIRFMGRTNGRGEIPQKLSRHRTRPVIASKGILALAGACAAEGAAKVVRRYLDQWHGRSNAPCCLLLQMLAWVEHPAAARLLLAVADESRTPSLRDEAARQAAHLAERRHCTLAELENILKSAPTQPRKTL